MERVKVVHLTSAHQSSDIRVFQKECRTLAEAGYEVVLVAPQERDEVVAGVTVRAVPRPKTRYERMAHTGRRVVDAALAERAAIYHIHDFELVPWIYRLRRGGAIVIFDMHENTYKDFRNKTYLPSWMRFVGHPLLRMVERVLLTHTPVVFANTSYVHDYGWIRKHVNVENMPMLERLLPIEEPKRPSPTVGYIGCVDPSRGSTLTLDVLRILKERGLSVGWDCVGEVPESQRQDLESRCRQWGLDAVHFLGYQLPVDGYKVMARCHVGLAMLEPLVSFFGAFPTKLFEYMALGLPVITSNFPLYRDVIEREGCGFCLDFHDTLAVANAVEYLIRNPDVARSMGQKGRAAVQARYRWDNEAAKLLAFYEELLRSRPRRSVASNSFRSPKR